MHRQECSRGCCGTGSGHEGEVPLTNIVQGEPDPGTVAGLIADLSRKYANLPEIIDRHGALSFAEIDERSLRMARALMAQGVSKGARVGILMPNGPDFLIALFAVMRIGGVAVLMSTLSRPPELAHMLRATEVDTLLGAASYLRNDYAAMLETALPSLAGSDGAGRLVLPEAPWLRAIWLWGDDPPAWAHRGPMATELSGWGQELARRAELDVKSSDVALIIFTSGSSADPKAVVHSHGNVVRQGRALSQLITCEPGDRILSTLPFFWVGGLCTVVLAAICSGAAVLCPDDPSAESTIACLRRDRATHIMHWPQQLDLMKDNPEFMALLAQMKPAYAHQFELFGHAPAELTGNSLGMTETLGPHSMYPPAVLPKNRAGSFGLAVGGIERRIVDPETGAELPPGEEGILCLRGGALMMGMHGKAHDEVFGADGFYRTDDVCSITGDGHLFFIGRGGDIAKVNGANVSPVEVEAAIRAMPGIKAVCVVGLKSGATGDTLVAAIVREEGAKVDPGALRDYLKTQLSSYKVPRHFVFLEEEEIPMTASAKIYKPALKELLTARLGAG